MTLGGLRSIQLSYGDKTGTVQNTPRMTLL